jgi:hypothetical protein
MQWSDATAVPSSRKLRQFAGIWILFFAGLALWQGWLRGHATAAVVFAALAMVAGPLGLLWPRTIRWIYTGWMIAAFPIGWVVSRLVLGLMYFGVITPVALLFRLLGRDALQRRFQPEADTYWRPKPGATDVRSYFRQF